MGEEKEEESMGSSKRTGRSMKNEKRRRSVGCVARFYLSFEAWAGRSQLYVFSGRWRGWDGGAGGMMRVQPTKRLSSGKRRGLTRDQETPIIRK